MEEVGFELLAVGFLLIGIWAFLRVVFSTDIGLILYLGDGIAFVGAAIVAYCEFPRKQ